jgi:hypothetical protein
MADYAAIKAGLGTVLEAAPNISVVYTNAPELIVTPAAIVLPGDTPAEYHQAMQGLTKFDFKVVVMVQRFESSSNLSRLDEYISGPNSIDALIKADRTLDGSVSDAYVVRCNTLGTMGTGDDTYLGAEFDIEVYA